MADMLTKCIVLILFAGFVRCDDIDGVGKFSAMAKLMRAMVNQTKADKLSLPANATSIRENITDTFSCENRTYGYYADVDNDCQLFHVCLPSQTPSGRNVTYKWSFICPSETVFNQEVLVCTRSRDSIPCDESPNYYDLNMEIGKETNNSREQTYETANTDNNPETMNSNDNNAVSNNNNYNTATNNNYKTAAAPNNKRNDRIKTKTQKRKQQNNKKQNLIVQKLIKEVIDEEMTKDEEASVEFGEKTIQIPEDEVVNEDSEIKIEDVEEFNNMGNAETLEDTMENSRLMTERRKKRERSRGMFRFKADV